MQDCTSVDASMLDGWRLLLRLVPMSTLWPRLPPRAWQQPVPHGTDNGCGDALRAEVGGGGVKDGRNAGHAVVPAVLVHRPLEPLARQGLVQQGLLPRLVPGLR